MKLEIDTYKITTHTQCNHGAYNDSCLCCMYSFAKAHRLEIADNGLEQTIKKYKKAGDFL